MSEEWSETKCILTWWCTDETEIDLSHIWVRSERDETRCILTWWCTDETEINLSHIWVRFRRDVWNRSRQNLSQIWAESKWWRLNLKFLTLTLRHHTRQYMWFFDGRIDEMIFIECLLTIIQKIERLSSRKVIFSIDVILEQRWIIASITLEV